MEKPHFTHVHQKVEQQKCMVTCMPNAFYVFIVKTVHMRHEKLKFQSLAGSFSQSNIEGHYGTLCGPKMLVFLCLMSRDSARAHVHLAHTPARV